MLLGEARVMLEMRRETKEALTMRCEACAWGEHDRCFVRDCGCECLDWMDEPAGAGY